jgi:hypothetical protein
MLSSSGDLRVDPGWATVKIAVYERLWTFRTLPAVHGRRCFPLSRYLREKLDVDRSTQHLSSKHGGKPNAEASGEPAS